MSLTRYSGPVYGAKSFLWGANFLAGSTGASSHLDARTVVPVGEDWYITEVGVATSTNSSGGQTWKIKTEGGSSGVPRYQGQPSTVAQTVITVDAGTSTSINSMNIISPTAGEYEGLYVPTGSTVRLVSSGAGAPSAVSVTVRGFIRFINSTRGEG